MNFIWCYAPLNLNDMKKQQFIVDVYMICNKTDEELPMKKGVLVEVEHVNGNKMGCLTLTNLKFIFLKKYKDTFITNFTVQALRNIANESSLA